jgi:hypothetical protein
MCQCVHFIAAADGLLARENNFMVGSGKMKNPYILALALVCGILTAANSSADSSERTCPYGESAQNILALANSTADHLEYDRDKMFLELQGPMRWETLAASHSDAVRLHPEVLAQWKDELADQCLWSVYFGCEPPHRDSIGGFGGCIDYPPDVWLLIDNETGRIIHTVRQTGNEWGYRIDH